jgi:hypothetical protein
VVPEATPQWLHNKSQEIYMPRQCYRHINIAD